jgi:DNA-binding NtrC family response regulator
VKHKFSILIADRNPHVRELLRREMTAEGYQVRLAENGRQLLKKAFQNEHLDLLIVDPDLPDVDGPSLLAELQDRIPSVPIIVHSFLSDQMEYLGLPNSVAFIEKQGRSIEQLKKMVSEILYTPRRTQGRENPIAKENKPLFSE